MKHAKLESRACLLALALAFATGARAQDTTAPEAAPGAAGSAAAPAAPPAPKAPAASKPPSPAPAPREASAASSPPASGESPAPAPADAAPANAAPANAAPANAAPANAAPSSAPPAAPLELAPWSEAVPPPPPSTPRAAPPPAGENAAAPTPSADAVAAPAAAAERRLEARRARATAPLVAAPASLASTRAAGEDVPLVPRDRVSAPPTPRFDAWLGVVDTLVPNAGLDAFSEDDQVPAFHAGVGAGLAPLAGGEVAAVATLDLGGTGASFRGEATDLGVVRLGLGPELRVPVFERLYLFGRIAPQAVRVSAELRESSSGIRLGRDQWTVGVDGALGAGLRVADLRPQALAAPLSLYVRLQGGFAWTPELDLRLAPTSSDAPVRTEPLALEGLSLSGFSFGASLGLGY